jgi:hypothetical protein
MPSDKKSHTNAESPPTRKEKKERESPFDLCPRTTQGDLESHLIPLAHVLEASAPCSATLALISPSRIEQVTLIVVLVELLPEFSVLL